MSEESQPLINQAEDNDVSMEMAPEPSPKEKALESFKKKLIDHREYDNKLKTCMYAVFLSYTRRLTAQCVWTYVAWTKSSSRQRTI